MMRIKLVVVMELLMITYLYNKGGAVVSLSWLHCILCFRPHREMECYHGCVCVVYLINLKWRKGVIFQGMTFILFGRLIKTLKDVGICPCAQIICMAFTCPHQKKGFLS